MTPAAISQQVRLLEDDLGIPLFRRLPRGLVLTEAARSCLPELQKGFAHLARAVTDARGGTLDGPLTISVIPSFAARWLTPRLISFVRTYPSIELTLRAEMRNVDFTRDEVDLGIRYGRGHYPGLNTHLLLTEEVFPVCAPSLLNGPKPLRRIEDLRHHVLLHDRDLSGDEPSLFWRVWLRDAGVPDFPAERGPGFSDATMMIEATIRGMGVSLGRSALVAEDLAAGRLVRPFAQSRPADFAYYVVMPEREVGNPRVRTFTTWLDDQAAQSRAVIGTARPAA